LKNPIELYIAFFWPTHEDLPKELFVRYRVLLYFNFFAILIGIYSAIKWTKLEHYVLVQTSFIIIVVCVLSSFLIKKSISPIFAANMYMVGSYPHGINMIHSLGGLDSAHIFWLPALVCISYLLANRKSGLFWFAVAFVTVLALIYLDRSGYAWPVFEFTEAGRKVDTYSGYLLPMFIIWIAQSYAFRIREESLADAVDAQKKSAAMAEVSDSNANYLGEILDEAKLTCQALSTSTNSLMTNLNDMKAHSQLIENGAFSQVQASEQISDTVNNTQSTLSETFQLFSSMEATTRETENNVSITAESMTKTTESMDKIKASFSRIEDVIQVISGIVSQTNLLALNATIEAARAGDRGKGFAVVADEIRSLSIRCDESAKEITDVIKQGSVDVVEGVQLVMRSAGILENTASSVQVVSEQIHSVSEVINKLNANMGGVAEATLNVGHASENNAKSVAHLLDSTSILSEVTHQLSDVSDKLEGVMNR
jgi:methyl-accepting chemotaxis protein